MSAGLLTKSTSCGMASGVKIEMRPPSGGMARGGRIKKRSRDVKRNKNKWSGKTEGKKVICRKKATDARRVSRSLQSPEQNEAVRVANKERMRKQRKEQEEAERDRLRRKVQSFLLNAETKCSGSSREKDSRCVCGTAIPSAEPVEEDSSPELVTTTTTTTSNSSNSIRSQINSRTSPPRPHYRQ